MRKIILVFILCMLSLTLMQLINAREWAGTEIIIFDDFQDGVFNNAIWKNYTGGIDGVDIISEIGERSSGMYINVTGSQAGSSRMINASFDISLIAIGGNMTVEVLAVPHGATNAWTYQRYFSINQYREWRCDLMPDPAYQVIQRNTSGYSVWENGNLQYILTPTHNMIHFNITSAGLNQRCELRIQNVTYTNSIPYYANHITYNNQSFETIAEIISLNVTYNSTRWDSAVAYLTYNNTQYTSSLADSGDNLLFSRSINTPLVDQDTNMSLFWTLSLTNSTGTFNYNTSSYNQSVGNLFLDNCSVYSTILLNYTLYDEETQELIDNVQNITVELDIDIYSEDNPNTINFSSIYSINNPRVCIGNLTSNYRLDAQARYLSDGRVEEFHNIQNSTLNNLTIPMNINLYDLNTSSSTTFLITVKDSSFLALENALIDITRKYVSEGVFKSVEIPETDSEGQAKAHLELEGVIYTIIVSRYGEILETFDNIIPICQNTLTDECTINLNILESATEMPDFEEVGGITYSESFDEDTRTVTFTFSTTDGTTRQIALNTTKLDRFGNDTVCTDTLTSSSGTLTCVVPDSYGNLTVISQLSSDGNLITTKIYTIAEDRNEAMGRGTVIIFAIILFLTIPMMFVGDANGLIIGSIIGIVIMGLMFAVTGSTFIGASSVLMWIVITGGILIYKINQR